MSDDIEYDGERITEIQERLDVIYRLQNKHQVASVEDLLSIQHNIQSRARCLCRSKFRDWFTRTIDWEVPARATTSRSRTPSTETCCS